MRPAAPPPRRRAGQQGLAALAVVLLLFFVVSLVAAYTSRNLIFEQRTGINQYRSTQAMETAEAALEWALLKLNGGRIDGDCEPSTEPSDTSYRERYLVVDPDKGFYAPRLNAATGTAAFATCVRDGAAWRCRCPATGVELPDAPAGDGPHPAFRVALVGSSTRPGMVRIYANACTRLAEACLAFAPNMSTLPIVRAVAPGGEGFAAISTWAGMTGRVPALERSATKIVSGVAPRDTIVARQDIGSSGGSLVAGRRGQDLGFAARAGGTIAGIGVEAAPGSPADTATALRAGDDALAGLALPEPSLAGMRMFASVFMMRPETFRDQPAAVVLDCGMSACDGSTLATTVALNPGRPIWVEGDLLLDGSGDIGSSAMPVTLVVTGDLDFDAGGRTVHGLVYGRAANWRLSGLARVEGALVAENQLDIATSPGSAVRHDPEVMRHLATLSGSFVRVPGSWKDFP
ncbi:fimbrial assembly protein [Rubrivivax sp. JA1024]|nr:fimbrial assembly protein [Rubrivivax sp. JA1024]